MIKKVLLLMTIFLFCGCLTTGDRQGIEGRAFRYLKLGNDALYKSKYKISLLYFNKSLVISKKIGDRYGEGATLNNIGGVYYALSDFSKALEYFEKSLVISKEIGDRYGEGATLNNIGGVYDTLLDFSKALEYFEKSLIIYKEIGNTSEEGGALTNIGGTYHKLLEFNQAFSFYEEAIHIIESLREDLKNEELKTVFFQQYIHIYKNTISCLYELHQQDPAKGYDKIAFTYTEKSKARGLLDLLTESKTNIRKGIDPELREQEQYLEREYARLNTSLQQELSKPDDSIDKEKADTLQIQLNTIEDRFEELKSRIIRENPRYARIKYPEPVAIKEAQRTLLDNNTVLVEYKVTKYALFAWRITRDDYRFCKLAVTEKELTDKIIKLRNCFSDPPLGIQDYAPVCNDLYEILLEPLLTGIEKKDKLLIIPDGILHYLPFETLADLTPGEHTDIKEETWEELTGKKNLFLINDYTITYAQSAGVACNIARDEIKTPRSNDLFAIGDPVFSDEESTEAGIYTRSALQPSKETKRDKLVRLIYSGEEVRNIARLFSKSDIYLKQEATEERLKEPGVLKNYRYIHLAAHSILNENKPHLSGIILTQDDDSREDGYLQTREIFNIELNADLVVLSACQTGLGKYVSGEGLVGLTRAWMYAGTPSVVVSLWPVEDKSTSYLMEEFYGNIQKGMSHSEALRKAKLALMERKDEYSHPVYWAPFVLIGDNK